MENFMPSNGLSSVAFIVAVFIEFFFLVDLRRERAKTVLIVIATALVCGLAALVPFCYGMHSTLGLYVVSWAIPFCFIAPLILGEKIVPPLNEQTLLIVNAISLYFVFKSAGPPVLLYVYGAATALSVLNALVPAKIGRILKIACFGWYFVLLLTIPLMHFHYGSLAHLVLGTSAVAYSEAIALGATLCFVLVQYMCLFQLLPLPTRNETTDQAFARVREYAAVLVGKYNDTQLPIKQSLALVSFLFILLGGNYYFGLISDNTMLAVALLVSALLEKHAA